MRNILRNSLLALAVAALSLGVAQAAPVNYTFAGITDGGSDHPNVSFSGTFSYLTEDVVAGATSVKLSSLAFDYLGDSFTLAMASANSAFADFDAVGEVYGIDAVFIRGIVETTLFGGYGAPFLPYLNYYNGDSGAFDAGDFTVSLVPSTQVPEPAALALVLAGFAAAGLATKRRRG